MLATVRSRKACLCRPLFVEKVVSVCWVLGLVEGSSSDPSPLAFPSRVGFFSCWFDLGNPYRQLLRVGFFPLSPSVAPVGYEPKLGSLRLSVVLRSLGSRSNAFSEAMAPTCLGWWTEW